MSLLDIVIRECRKHGIRVLLLPSEEVRYPGTTKPYLGYFVVDPGGTTAALCCGMTYSHWEEILLHEYNHARQWIEKDPVWDGTHLTPEEAERYGVRPDQETLDVIHRWLAREIEIAPEELTRLFDRSIAVEMDCERRTQEMGTELFEDWFPEYYAQRVNGYLRAYKYAELTRVWPEPDNEEDLWDQMPTTLDLDYFAPITEAEKAIFDAFV